MKNTFRTSVLLFALAVVSASSVHAFGMPKIPSLSGGSSEAAVNPEQILKSLSEAVVELEYANAAYLDALGKKTEAALARDNADKLKSGSVGVKAAIEQSSATSETMLAAMKENSAKAARVDEASKSKFSQGLIHHVAGTISGVKSGKQLKSALNAPQNLATFAPVAGFPGLIQKWTSSTEQVLKYLGNNGIDVGPAKAQISQGMADAA